MKQLLKNYNLNSDMQYFEVIANSFITGQISQGKELFAVMSKKYRKQFITSAMFGGWHSGLSENQLQTLFTLI